MTRLRLSEKDSFKLDLARSLAAQVLQGIKSNYLMGNAVRDMRLLEDAVQTLETLHISTLKRTRK